jgi:tetratricopeptide (TPR) repeat protein
MRRARPPVRARTTALGVACASVIHTFLAGCGAAAVEAPTGAPPTDPVAEVGAQRLFETGLAAAAQGDYVRAEQYLAAAGARGHDETAVIGPLVRVCVASSRLRQALVYAQPYLRRHPDDWRLRFVVAATLLALERIDESRGEYERVVTSAPDAPEPWFALGVLLRDQFRDDAAARPRFERYLALAPEGPHADEARVALANPLPAPTSVPAGDPPIPNPPATSTAPSAPSSAPPTPAPVAARANAPAPVRVAPSATGAP